MRKFLLLILLVFAWRESCAEERNPYCVYVDLPEGFVSQMEVVGCFCEYEGKVLLLLRNPEKPQGNTWCIPGGKVEKGETVMQAIAREVDEETGILLPMESLTYCRKVFVRLPTSTFTLHLFHAYLPEFPNTFALGLQEHSSFRWVTYEEALELPLIPGGKECLCLGYEVVKKQVISCALPQ